MLLERATPIAEKVWQHACHEPIDALSFDAHFLPEIERLAGKAPRGKTQRLSRADQRREREMIAAALLTVTHRLYLGLVLDQRPELGLAVRMRIFDLAGYLAEQTVSMMRASPHDVRVRQTAANVLVGLAMCALIEIERFRFVGDDVASFTDVFERAIVTTTTLRTLAEASGLAPGFVPVSARFESRLEQAVERAARELADQITRRGKTASMAQTARMLDEHETFLARFATYLRSDDVALSPGKSSMLAGGAAVDEVVAATGGGDHIVLTLRSGRQVAVDARELTRVLPQIERRE